MALIGTGCSITTHNSFNLILVENNFIEQGFITSLRYSNTLSPNNNGRLVHRGQLALKYFFQLNTVVPLNTAEAFYLDFEDYQKRQRAGIAAANWSLINNRMKTINSLNGVLSFATFFCYPESVEYIPINNDFADLNCSLIEA